MVVRIPAVLAAAELTTLRDQLGVASWTSGSATAGFQSVAVKDNQQLPHGDPLARECGALIVAALERNPLFLSAALPRHVFPPMFNRYENGMAFGAHVDNAVRQVPATSFRLRTDLSATLFLSAPADYDGGELVIQDTYGEHRVKLPAGDLVLYPAGSVHRVEAVTRGARVASIFWVQSMVRDPIARELLFELDDSIRELSAAGTARAPLVRLTGLYHNLVRRWGDL
ncbi:MAG: Fe2+-dependent dioxygenase [Gammaproteobacteria bacterium]|nr:Fe2+-dependent dioxygenase [Gammaproteobacteria bacterium]